MATGMWLISYWLLVTWTV